MLCPRQVFQVRCSWECHERCTAVLIVFLMIVPVHMPHGGHDEEDYITELEIAKIIMEEGKMGAKDFINIELKLEGEEGKFQGLDSLDWYGLYGP